MSTQITEAFERLASHVTYAHDIPTTYSTLRDYVLVAESDPGENNYCMAIGGVFLCNRAKAHFGRHARVRYGLNGRVRAVWGRKPLRQVNS